MARTWQSYGDHREEVRAASHDEGMAGARRDSRPAYAACEDAIAALVPAVCQPAGAIVTGVRGIGRGACAARGSRTNGPGVDVE